MSKLLFAVAVLGALGAGCSGGGARGTRDVSGDRRPPGGSRAASDAGAGETVPEPPRPVEQKPEVGKKPRLLVRATTRALAIDATHLYYGDSEDDGVYSIAKAGGDPVRLARHAPVAGAIALDGMTITWIASPGDTVLRAPLRGGGQPITLRDRGIFSDVATAGSDVFIIEALGAGGALTRVTGATASRLASFDLPPRAVMADATHAFVITPTKIFRTTHVKGELETIASGTGFANPQMDDAFLYVVAEQAGARTVARVPKAGGPMTTIARGLRDAPFELEGSDILFFDVTRPQVRVVRTTGGDSRVVIEDEALLGATAIVADSTSIFIATAARDSAAILTVPRR